MRTNLNSNSTPHQAAATNNRAYRSRYGGRQYPAFQRREWVTVARITVEQAERSVRIRFPDKPSDRDRDYLKLHDFSWSKSSGFWYAKLNPQNVEFALKLEAEGFPAVPVEQFVGAEI
jgi:hypothetical protein